MNSRKDYPNEGVNRGIIVVEKETEIPGLWFKAGETLPFYVAL